MDKEYKKIEASKEDVEECVLNNASKQREIQGLPCCGLGIALEGDYPLRKTAPCDYFVKGSCVQDIEDKNHLHYLCNLKKRNI